MGVTDGLEGIARNTLSVARQVADDVLLPGVLLGVAGLGVGVWRRRTRRPALVFSILGLSAFCFHSLYYTDPLVMLLMMISLPLAAGWLFGAQAVLDWAQRQRRAARLSAWAALAAASTGLAAALASSSAPFIRGLTSDPAGLRTRQLWQSAPPGAAAMIAWGPRHFAAGFTRDVEGLRTDVLLLDHKADYRAILRDRRLVTPDYTFFNQPPAWWEERLGTAPVFSSPAPGWVEVRFTPEIRDVPPPDGLPIVVLDAHAVCAPGGLALAVTWAAARIPHADWSVYVHALAADGALLGQGDQRAPVYGLRPAAAGPPAR